MVGNGLRLYVRPLPRGWPKAFAASVFLLASTTLLFCLAIFKVLMLPGNDFVHMMYARAAEIRNTKQISDSLKKTAAIH